MFPEMNYQALKTKIFFITIQCDLKKKIFISMGMCFTPLFPTPSVKKDVCEFLCHFFLIFLICVSASVFSKMLPNTKHNYFGNIHFIQSPIYTIYILDPRYTINFAPSGWIIRYVHLNLSVHYGLESIHSLKVQLLKIFINVIKSTQFANKYKVAIMGRVFCSSI